MFDGGVFKHGNVRRDGSSFIINILNKGQFPDYLRKGRLVLLSKQYNGYIVPVEETRPIVINSNFNKVNEKAIKHKLMQMNIRLLHVENYSAGFYIYA